ncbi:cytochrome P450 [Streptomyces griseofuscus]|uniref:Cytochrome P450 n=1 Tax=Streptomyces griseofuscus TaxID=146922 RepID=A0A7H1QBV2_9ACTN|nr:cytochrome P450 [Streptomyces griseofuscus]QNT97782.1 cytochrome P450 [Streptomyces griseofuscus]
MVHSQAAENPSAQPFPTARPAGCPFDPPAPFARARAECPITPLRYPDGHIGQLVTGLETARSVLADTRFSSLPAGKRSPVKVPGSELSTDALPAGMFVNMDPPEHTRYRRLLSKHFTIRRVRELRPRIQELTDRLLDEMASASGPVDLVQAFAKPLPTLVTSELLGLPEADRAEFGRHVDVLFSLSTTGEEMQQSMAILGGMLHALIAAARKDAGPDILGRLTVETDLTDEELLGITIVLLIAGLETTTNMLALGTYALLRHSEQLAALRADWSLMDDAVEELLRYLSVVQIGPIRVAAEDFEFEGRSIRAGQVVTVSLPAANRDPLGFEDPDTFDIRRGPSRHMAFGNGPHQCMGHHLARLELAIGYESLLRRFPRLELAVPPQEIGTREMMVTYGVLELPVRW